ncbi:General transcription factor II-I repeat domain-containing protein 2A [Holothuria leucospilota]|uniref:General transcription factor II-I repeat domain-containing protein 2A n=1 Tax=Holothuria leucospilota TaxID=206669 RepID=A0A9Q1HAI7_HOLLE|nr:General transcription factor II-I repeat domain-containing protein 2A [Holothuria leucospilota]
MTHYKAGCRLIQKNSIELITKDVCWILTISDLPIRQKRRSSDTCVKMQLTIITACVLLMVPLSKAGYLGCQICGGKYPDLNEELSQVREAAVQWLADQQNGDGSWPSVNTQNAILGLQLANTSWLASQGLDERLLTKSRLDVELLRQLLPVRSEVCDEYRGRGTIRFPGWSQLGCPGTFERGAGILAQYMLSLQSICCPTDDFYGVNLKCTMTNLLRDFPEDNFNNFFQYSFAILSMCSCDADIFWKALRKLAEGSDKSDPCYSPFGDDSGRNIDILSMQVMAMTCARDQAIYKNVPNWDAILDARIQCILDGQNNDDGSFGNSITTALAIQALTAAGTDPTVWFCNATASWLLRQQTNGDFGGVGATAQILPFLYCNNFGSLRNITIDCPEFDEQPMPPPINPGDPTVNFNLEVIVDDTNTTYSVTILEGENLYFGMIRLAYLDPNFTQHKNGHIDFMHMMLRKVVLRLEENGVSLQATPTMQTADVCTGDTRVSLLRTPAKSTLRQFKMLLNDLDSEYGDLVYHCEVRWLSRGNMLMRFYQLRDEAKQFMKMKGKPVAELSDSKWLCDLAFMVDITKYLSELNVKLQGPTQLLSSLLSNVRSFEAKLKLCKAQFDRGNTVHFPTLQGQKPSTTSEYAAESAKLIEAFGERFQDVKEKQEELSTFATPFNVEPVDVPENLQLEIIQLQSNDELKARYNNLPLLEFYQRYIRVDDFPILRRHALRYASVFGTTYCCEQFFSKLTLAQNRLRSRLTDTNLERQLRLATSSIKADTTSLIREKQFQPSHKLKIEKVVQLRKFVTSDSAFGQSIDAINGVADDADSSLYWTIHIGQEGTFAPRGIEGLYPTEGETYLFILTDFS